MLTIGEVEAKLESAAALESAATPIVPVVEPVATPAVASPVAEPTPVAEPASEPLDNEASFDLPDYGKPATEPKAEAAPNSPQAQVSWEDAIKDVDKKELLKKAGVSGFVIEMNEHIANGGNPVDYLNAKSIDYNSFSDEDIIKSDLKKQFPFLSKDEVERMINKKYGLTGGAEDDADGLLMLKTDAHSKRTSLINEQQRFKIAEPIAKVNEEHSQQEQQAQQAELESRMKAFEQRMRNEPANKSLLEEKKISINLGEGVTPFNIKVSNPELLVSPQYNQEALIRAMAKNPQEVEFNKLELDPAKVQRMMLVGLDPNYERNFYNYGLAQGMKKVVSEGQNAQRQPQQQAAASNASLGQTFSTSATKGTIGGLLQKLGG